MCCSGPRPRLVIGPPTSTTSRPASTRAGTAGTGGCLRRRASGRGARRSREVLLRVVDDAVGAERARPARRSRAADGGHSAPKNLASCTANVPTPPDAPLISTFCPGWTWPWSRSACSAVRPAIGTAAASSNETFGRLRDEPALARDGVLRPGAAGRCRRPRRLAGTP